MTTIGKVRNVAMIGLLTLAGGIAGCGGGSCGGNVAAEWVLTQNGTQVSCLPGDEVDINVDAMSAPFACSDMAGTTPAVAAGRNHSISLTLLDGNGNVLSQTQTMSLFVPCGAVADIGQVELSLTP